MKKYIEKERELKNCATVDVLVVGSGPSGFAAAYAAAKNGADTMIIEQNGDIGGISTSGLMSHWTGSVNSALYSKLLKRSAEKNEGEWKNKITNLIDPEKLKTLYLEMLMEAGCKIKLYTFASDVIMEDNKVKGVIIESKSGRETIFANTVIDASGDGDIAAKAGVSYQLGRETDGKMQPATIMFKIAGVDTENAVYLGSFESTYETEKGELQALAKQHLPFPAGHVLLYHSTLPGIVTCNMTNCTEVDGTNADDLTKATITCRKQMDKIIAFLREFVPGYENCFAISSASFIGIRETRHFKGKYTLTENDILNAKVFDHWIVRDAFFNFDVHNISGAGLDETGCQKDFHVKKGYTIPYECLLPQEKENLLLCGRNISGTHMAHSNFRAMPICLGIGEAAGIAAALAAKQHISLCDVKAEEIQKILLEECQTNE